MNIVQQAFLTTSVPADVQVILAVSCPIVAVLLINLVIEAGLHPYARNTLSLFLSADYCIKRYQRRGFGYRHTAARATLQGTSPMPTDRTRTLSLIS